MRAGWICKSGYMGQVQLTSCTAWLLHTASLGRKALAMFRTCWRCGAGPQAGHRPPDIATSMNDLVLKCGGPGQDKGAVTMLKGVLEMRGKSTGRIRPP